MASPQDNFEESSCSTTSEEEFITSLCDEQESVKRILVIGPVDSGKLSVIEALFGSTSLTKLKERDAASQVEIYEINSKIRVYKPIGFGNIEGKSHHDIIKEIARLNKFHLVLICVRLDLCLDGNVKSMFSILHEEGTDEIWKRSIVVLTHANTFLNLDSINELPNDKLFEKMSDEIKKFKDNIYDFIRKPVASDLEMPFCVAGSVREKNLPTTVDWIDQLRKACLNRFNGDACHLIKKRDDDDSALEVIGLIGAVSLATLCTIVFLKSS